MRLFRIAMWLPAGRACTENSGIEPASDSEIFVRIRIPVRDAVRDRALWEDHAFDVERGTAGDPRTDLRTGVELVGIAEQRRIQHQNPVVASIVRPGRGGRG